MVTRRNIEEAERRINTGEILIKVQRRRLANLRSKGLPTHRAETLLGNLLDLQEEARRYRAILARRSSNVEGRSLDALSDAAGSRARLAAQTMNLGQLYAVVPDPGWPRHGGPPYAKGVAQEEALRTSRYWQDRAEDARATAENMKELRARKMLDIAQMYEMLATRAAAREARENGKR